METEVDEQADIDAAIQAHLAAMSVKGPDDDAATASTHDSEQLETAAEIVKAFSSMEGNGSGGKSALREEIETFRMAEGKDHKDDAYVTNEYMGLKALRAMVEAAEKKAGGLETKKGRKWAFSAVPLEQFRRTVDDVFLAFLRWAKVEEVKEGGGGSAKDKGRKHKTKENESERKVGQINVSKAFRRLTVYAAWMEENRDDLEGWLQAENVFGAWNEWKMGLSYDKRGRIVWWMDLTAVDEEKLRALPHVESFRLFVWLSHVIMFDINAQRNGLVFACDFAKMGFWQSMGLFSMKLGLKLDRLTIGVLPVKMKRMFILGSPTWWDVLMGIMSPFMSKKLRQRIINVKDAECDRFVKALGGAEFVPLGFHNCGGVLEKEIVSDTHFLSLKERYALEES